MDKHSITLYEMLQMPLGERITGIVTYHDEIIISTECRVFKLCVNDIEGYDLLPTSIKVK